MKAIINAKLVYPDSVQEGAILFENGRIIASGDIIPPEKADLIDAKGMYVGPGLVDIHCHGYAEAGENPTVYSMVTHPAEAARAHLRHGTTSVTPSAAYSWNREDFLTCIRNCQADIKTGNSPILGIHFEGPFTNPKYGSNSKSAWKFSEEACDAIFNAAGSDVLHCTYAPELPFAPAFEEYLAKRGVIADVGHTEMSPDDLNRAVKNGARIVTHLFDAMGCWRGNDSISTTGVIQETAAEVALSTPGLYYELICDSRGVHVKPANVRLALRTAGEDHIIVITDCAEFASHNPADYPEDSPMSAPDLNYNSAGELSGSRLTLSDAAVNFKRFTGADVHTVFKCAATNPAKALRVDNRVGSILTGRDANLLIVDEDFKVQSVYFHGSKVEA